MSPGARLFAFPRRALVAIRRRAVDMRTGLGPTRLLRTSAPCSCEGNRSVTALPSPIDDMASPRLLPLALALALLGPANTLAQSTFRGRAVALSTPVEVHHDPSARIVERYVDPAWAVPRSVAPGRGPAASGAVAPAPGRAPREDRQELLQGICFDNSVTTSAWYDLSSYPQEVVDFGGKSCGSSGLVGIIGFAVRTTRLPVVLGGPGYRIGLRIYNNTNLSGLGTVIADYEIVGDGEPFAPGGAAYLTGMLHLPTPLRVPDYNPFAGSVGLGWSYYWIEDGTDPLLARTLGPPCDMVFTQPSDPTTGTFDCLYDYDYPAGPSTYFGRIQPLVGMSSLYLRLWEEVPYLAQANSYTVSPNLQVYSAFAPVIGEPWSGQVLIRRLHVRPALRLRGLRQHPAGGRTGPAGRRRRQRRAARLQPAAGACGAVHARGAPRPLARRSLHREPGRAVRRDAALRPHQPRGAAHRHVPLASGPSVNGAGPRLPTGVAAPRSRSGRSG